MLCLFTLAAFMSSPARTQPALTSAPSPVRTLPREKLVELHPPAQGWRHMVFDDADVALFVQRHYPEVWPVYQSFGFKIMRFDLFRLLAVHHYGGFYLGERKGLKSNI